MSTQEIQRSQLLGRTLAGLRTTGMLTVVKTVVDLGGQLALARLLAPEAFGFFGFAQTLSGLVSCLTDLAGQRYVVKHKGELTRAVYDTVYTVELLLGVVVAAVWALLAGPVLAAAGHPEQAAFARALALWILLERLMLPKALLDRKLDFKHSNLAGINGTIASVASMLVAGALGAGAWTFIVGLVVRSAVTVAFTWYWVPQWPRLSLDRDVVKGLLGFGGPILITSLLTFYYQNVDYLIVGSGLGYAALGFYYAAYRYPHYVRQFQVLISGVVYPAFTKATDRAQLARGFTLLTKYAAAIGAPILVLVWVLGEDLVRVLLSEKWVPATFCFQIFAGLAVFRLVTVFWYEAYVVHGKTGIIPYVSAVNAVLTTAGAWLGIRWAGIEGAAVLVTAASVLTLTYYCQALLRPLLQVRYLDMLRVPLIAAAVAGWTGYFVASERWLSAGWGPLWLDLGLRAGFLLAVFGAVFIALDWKDLRDLLRRARR